MSDTHPVIHVDVYYVFNLFFYTMGTFTTVTSFIGRFTKVPIKLRHGLFCIASATYVKVSGLWEKTRAPGVNLHTDRKKYANSFNFKEDFNRLHMGWKYKNNLL